MIGALLHGSPLASPVIVSPRVRTPEDLHRVRVQITRYQDDLIADL